jgi:phosphate transport system protein
MFQMHFVPGLFRMAASAAYDVKGEIIPADHANSFFMALRQPAARDLRFITTAIKITGHLERIGDMAANIAEKVLILNDLPQIKPYIDLPRMAEISRGMIRMSLDAMVHEDIGLAMKVREEDTVIDQLNDQIFRELLTFMMEDPRKIQVCLYVMQISKSMERIADHAEGIADMVIYMVTGKSVRHKPASRRTDGTSQKVGCCVRFTPRNLRVLPDCPAKPGTTKPSRFETL